MGGLYLEGLIHGGAYFQNFTVSHHTFQRLHIPVSSNKEISPLGGNTPKINFPRSLILAIHINLTLQYVNIKIVVTDEGKFVFMVSLSNQG